MQDLDQIILQEKLEPDSKELQELLGKYPLNLTSLLALYYNHQGFPEKGLSLLISALDKEPERWELYEQLAFLAVKAGNHLGAEKVLLKAQALFPDSSQICGSLGKLYFLGKKFKQSEEVLEKSIKLNPAEGVNHIFWALNRLALFSEEDRIDNAELSEFSRVEKEIQITKELNPEIIDDDLLKGEILLTQGNPSEAFSFLEKSLKGYLEKRIEFSRLHKFFFSFFLESGGSDLEQLKDYIYELEKKLKLAFSSAEEISQVSCAYLLFFINLIKSAEEQLEKACSLDPEFEASSKALGFLEEKKKEIVSLFNSLKF